MRKNLRHRAAHRAPGPRLALLLGLLLCGAAVPATAQPAQGAGPTGGTPSGSVDFGGVWATEFGTMELHVEGKEVTGTYSCCQGTIRGVIKGTQIEFRWDDPVYGQGWGYFYWQEPGDRLRGTFAYEGDFGSAGSWNAVRVPALEPKGELRRYRVVTRHPRHGEFDGVATLDVAAGKVRGRIEGHYGLEARSKPFRFEMVNLITGEQQEDGSLELHWADPVYGTEGGLHLRPVDGALQGVWAPHFHQPGDAEVEISLVPLAPPGGGDAPGR